MTTETPSTYFDTYTWFARVAPAVLAAAPAMVFGLVALPWLDGVEKLWPALSLGLTGVAALIARRAGQRVQPALWAQWGGAPAASRLRFRGATDAAEIQRRHEDFERLLAPGLTLPTNAEEQADPLAADARYQQAVRRAIGRLRGQDGEPLLTLENRNYGFARNLYGLKTFALVLAWVTLGCAVGVAAFFLKATGSVPPSLAVPAVTSVLGLVAWHFIDEEAVRPAAEAYANRLLDAVERKVRP